MLGSGLLSTSLLLAGARLFDPADAQPADGERARIQRHLAYVEATLRVETPAALPPERRAARERALAVLHEYWTAGVFPRNRDFLDRHVPYFIDDDGRACAVCGFQAGPVCGADGKTYVCAAIAECAGVEVAHEGEYFADVDPDDPTRGPRSPAGSDQSVTRRNAMR
jgi:hypothetical protein